MSLAKKDENLLKDKLHVLVCHEISVTEEKRSVVNEANSTLNAIKKKRNAVADAAKHGWTQPVEEVFGDDWRDELAAMKYQAPSPGATTKALGELANIANDHFNGDCGVTQRLVDPEGEDGRPKLMWYATLGTKFTASGDSPAEAARQCLIKYEESNSLGLVENDA